MKNEITAVSQIDSITPDNEKTTALVFRHGNRMSLASDGYNFKFDATT